MSHNAAAASGDSSPPSWENLEKEERGREGAVGPRQETVRSGVSLGWVRQFVAPGGFHLRRARRLAACDMRNFLTTMEKTEYFEAYGMMFNL